ncbi:MAG: NAD(P)H-dependent oxidoreductase [Bacteroidia bacterium]|nr:NAD(P)H-dependent oxidoreductase [Bacteroidia bacterium]
MNKIVVYSCTNRENSNTLKVSRVYENILKELKTEPDFLDFRSLPENIAFSETFGKRTEAYSQLIRQFISEQNRFVFVVPEYNGSFPGILKTVLDSVHPKEWTNKKACLVGVSDGRAGNLRGMEHLTGILQYLKMHVYHHKLPISQVGKVMDANGDFMEEQRKVCELQLKGFLEF